MTNIFGNKRNQIKKILLDFAFHNRSSLLNQVNIANADLTFLSDADADRIHSGLLFLQAELYSITKSRLPRIKYYENEMAGNVKVKI